MTVVKGLLYNLQEAETDVGLKRYLVFIEIDSLVGIGKLKLGKCEVKQS